MTTFDAKAGIGLSERRRTRLAIDLCASSLSRSYQAAGGRKSSAGVDARRVAVLPRFTIAYSMAEIIDGLRRIC
ncbi:hypothetical protein [Gordonia sp. GAMMA]|uniref:hypothetical protein n=1 Tax=Gordonia sp. GAMMA TaxID=2502241 RepID=UPI00201727DB|nr:hypothetical protein [Gordonia sp. GAMMA]